MVQNGIDVTMDHTFIWLRPLTAEAQRLMGQFVHLSRLRYGALTIPRKKHCADDRDLMRHLGIAHLLAPESSSAL